MLKIGFRNVPVQRVFIIVSAVTIPKQSVVQDKIYCDI